MIFSERTCLRRCAIRLLAAYLLLTAVFFLYGNRYSEWLCAGIQWVATPLFGPLNVRRVETAELNGEPVFRVRAVAAQSLYVSHGMVPAGTAMGLFAGRHCCRAGGDAAVVRR